MIGLASFLISMPAILLLWMSFSSNNPYRRTTSSVRTTHFIHIRRERARQVLSRVRRKYLSILEDEESHILSVVDFIPPENWWGIVLDPHSCQFVPMNIVAFESTLCMIVHEYANIVRTSDSALRDKWVCVLPTHVNARSTWKGDEKQNWGHHLRCLLPNFAADMYLPPLLAYLHALFACIEIHVCG